MIYDIAVIGAGPAGATFARQAAGKGKILLLNGQSEQRKKPCGGLLAPDAQKALAHFDLVLPKQVLVDPQIFSVQTIDLEKNCVRYYQRYYLNMDRYAFDQWLLSLVPPEVEIVASTCFAIEKAADHFCLRVRSSGQEQTFFARQIVGADGANSIVRQRFYSTRILKYVAIQQWFESKKPGTPFYSCIFDPKTSESCSWLIQKDGLLLYGGCFLPQGCRAAYEKQKQRLAAYLGYSLGKPIKTEACLACRPKHPLDFVTGRDGAYLIGEAAGFISASSFEGISSAILSGNLLAEAYLAGDGPEAMARRYRRKTWRLRLKLASKIVKRWFMYTPWVRACIMWSGLSSIRVLRRQAQ